MAARSVVTKTSWTIVAIAAVAHFLSLGLLVTETGPDRKLAVSDIGATLVILFTMGIVIWRQYEGAAGTSRGYLAAVLVFGLWMAASPLLLGLGYRFPTNGFELGFGLILAALAAFELVRIPEDPRVEQARRYRRLERSP
ncbi:MAG TPA: hypothetical protein VM889_00190 [Candidatus Thermoplasmatota archaeon]|nr:hypothetical protein [Candidatus Thermoplasmatota archaeon]